MCITDSQAHLEVRFIYYLDAGIFIVSDIFLGKLGRRQWMLGVSGPYILGAYPTLLSGRDVKDVVPAIFRLTPD